MGIGDNRNNLWLDVQRGQSVPMRNQENPSAWTSLASSIESSRQRYLENNQASPGSFRPNEIQRETINLSAKNRERTHFGPGPEGIDIQRSSERVKNERILLETNRQFLDQQISKNAIINQQELRHIDNLRSKGVDPSNVINAKVGGSPRSRYTHQ